MPAPNFNNVSFLQSVFKMRQLPEPIYPEIAFAGRSNVGKSTLINRLVGRRNLVKISSRPGKTQSLNFFVSTISSISLTCPATVSPRSPKSTIVMAKAYCRLHRTSRTSGLCRGDH